jgi:hypothetical protein
MNTTIVKKPFLYSLTDDFLSKEDFDFLLKYIKSVPMFSNSEEHYTEKYHSDVEVEDIGLMKEELKERLFSYCSIILNEIFEPINSCSKKYDTVREQIELYNWGMNGTYFDNIHCDIPEKVVSCVLYIYPEKQTGTYIYDTIMPGGEWVEPGEEIEWKQNRLLSFVSYDGQDGGPWTREVIPFKKTYHCVKNNYGTQRVTANFNNKMIPKGHV